MNYLYILYLSHFDVEMQNQLLKTENVENGGGCFCLFLKKVDSILTLKINISISVRNQLTLLAAEVDLFSWNG